MKIAVLGSGMVGQALCAGLHSNGHEVMMGTRDPNSEKIHAWLKSTGGVRAGSFVEAAQFGEIAFLCTAWSGTESALQLVGEDSLAGKVVIDVTNPLEFTDKGPRLVVGHTDSGGEQVQRWLPKAHVVKALNTVTAGTMISPQREEGTPDMFIAGNDPGAKQKVTELLKSFGWSVIDMGGIEESRLLEPLAMIWIKYYIRNKTFTHAFRLLRQ
ncbi:MAG: NADPH-dependent F420 reductase [Polyangia bacterium]